MRIAFVAWHGSLHTRRWAAYCAEAGHDVHVVTCGGGDAEANGYEVHDLGAPPLGKPSYLLRARAARRVLSDIDPDLVHVHWLTSYGMLGLLSGVRPLVATAHGDDVLIAPRNPLYRLVVTRVLRVAELVTVPSEQMRRAVQALAGPETPVEVFQYGVETERLASLSRETRADCGRRSATLRIVSARPLLRLYRFDALLDALALLSTRGLEWTCELFGGGSERRKLEARALRLGLDGRVVFRGQRPPDEVERALAGADVYVSVSESDGASVALLEALALGPMPVVSDIPANRAWVENGVNGTLTPIEAGAIADAIERAIALDADAVRAYNQRLVAENADRERNLSAFDAKLRALVSAPRARSDIWRAA